MTLPYLGDLPEPGKSLPNLARFGKDEKSFTEKIDSFMNWGVDGDNPIDNALWGTPEERERKKLEARNRDNNLMKIVESGFGIRDTPEGKEVRDAWKAGVKNADNGALEKTRDDLGNMFDKSTLQDIDDWVESFKPTPGKSGKARLGSALTSTLSFGKGIVELPVIMAEQLLNATVLPVDLSKEKITALTSDQISDAQKATLGNLAAVVVAPMVSKAMQGLHTGIAVRAATGGEALTLKGAKAAFASQAIETTAKAGAQKYGIGIIGRAIIDDVTAGAVAGAAWGGISNANEEDMIESMMTGMMLGSIGIGTGLFRGASERMKGGRTYKGPDEVRELAKDALMANSLRITSETSTKNAVNNIRAVLKADSYAEAIMTGEVSVHRDSYVVLDGLEAKDNYAGLEVLTHKNTSLMLGPEAKITGAERIKFENFGELPESLGKQRVTAYGKEYFLERMGEKEASLTSMTGTSFTVPKDDVRLTGRASEVVPPEAVIKTLFNEFETKYPFNEGTSWRTNVKKFLTEKGISEKTEAFSTAFANIMSERYKGEALPANVSKFNEQLLEPHYRMLSEANTNGMYIHEVGTMFELRDMADSKKVFSSHKLSDIRKHLKEMGQVKAEPLDAGLPIPSDAIPVSVPAPPPSSVYSDPFAQPHPEGSTRASRWVQKFDMMHPAITSFRHVLDGFDGTYGTLFGGIEKEARDASILSRERINTEMKSKDVEQFKYLVERMSEGKRDLLVARMETMHPDEIRTAYGMTKKAQQIAQDVLTSGEDIHVIQKYKRLIETKQETHKAKANKDAVKEFDLLDKTNLTPSERDARSLEIIKKFHEAALTKPEYLADVQAINDAIKPSPAFLKTYQELLAYPAEQQAISRLADALGDRENYGLTQAEFDNKHGFKANDIAAAKHMEMLYVKYAKEFGIGDARLVPHYVNHYRQYGDVLDTNLEALEAGMESKGVRQFASEMVRTGEVVNYQRDPLQVMQAYIRSGVKGQRGGFYQKMGELAERVKKEQDKIPHTTLKESVGRAWADFDAVLSGRNVLEAERANEIQQQYLRNKGMRPEQIADIMAQPNGLASVLALINSSLMGARVSMGLRDGYTAISTFYAFNGMERTVNFLKQVVDRKTMKTLQETGVITLQSYESIYENSASQAGAFGKATGVTRMLADKGFKWSMQGYVNTLAQGASYMETLVHTGKHVDNYLKKKITLEQLKEEVFFNSYDEHVKHSFNNALINGQAESASKVLAFAQRDRIAGQFGVGSGTSGGSSTFGKIFNQMGSFSTQYRSTMLKGMTRGTNKEIGHFIARHIGAQSAMLGAAGVAGFNLSSWVVGPANMMFAGGPLLSIYQDVKAASDATLGGSEAQKGYAYRQLERSALMFVPWGYSMRSLKIALQLTQGTGYGAGRVLGQALGVNVKKDNGYRSWWDEWSNNYPTLR